MVGKEYRSVGGGTNYLCLPDDPQYDLQHAFNKPGAGYHIFRRGTRYRGFSDSSINRRVPCVTCETNQRVNRIMIPAKISCPSSDWTLEYQGFIMSMAEHNGQGDNDLFDDDFYATSYVCVDSNPETLSGYASGGNRGSLIYMVGADCSGIGALRNCPPYKQGPALPCVVCSK